jgi:TPR repeat protein
MRVATFSLLAIPLFIGVMTVHAVDYGGGYHAYYRGDYATALLIFRQLAEQGDTSAQSALGHMYITGRGVPQDYAEAMKWHRKAADKGDASAMNNVGWMYNQGQGVPQNYTEAAKWYRKAANLGDANAQNNLGILHSQGLGVPLDDVLAYMWFNLSAAQGGEIATQLRDTVRKRMSREQIAEAQRLTREWKPTKGR